MIIERDVVLRAIVCQVLGNGRVSNCLIKIVSEEGIETFSQEKS